MNFVFVFLTNNFIFMRNKYFMKFVALFFLFVLLIITQLKQFIFE